MTKNISELANVRRDLESWLSAFNAKDVDTLISFYDPESIYANAGAPLMRGVAQIRPWYDQAMGNIQGKLLFKEEAAFQDGNLALLVGAYYFQPPTGSTSPEDPSLTGRVALVYRRNGDGDWKLLFDMDNAPPDVSAADFA